MDDSLVTKIEYQVSNFNDHLQNGSKIEYLWLVSYAKNLLKSGNTLKRNIFILKYLSIFNDKHIYIKIK